MLIYRIQNRLRQLQLRGLGKRTGRVVPVSASRSFQITQNYAGVKCQTLVESDGLSKLQPAHLPEDASETLQPFQIECESVLLDIINPGFSFRSHVLLDPDLNVVFVDTLPEETILAFRRYVPKNCRQLRGTVAYLSNTWIDNYYHWMQLTLPLLRLYRELAPHTGIDYYYVGESHTSRLQEETLAQLGIRKSQIVREPCHADRLLTAIYLHRPQHREMRYRDVWGHRFVRSIFPRQHCPDSPKRIHIERGNVPMRRLANEKEVVACLRQLQFVSLRMDGMTVASQARLFANAEVILGVHGAALTNLLFSQPGTKVIELFPPSAQEPGMFTAATHSDLDYYYLLGEPGNQDRKFDVRVNLEKLAALLRMAGLQGA
jgi:hypothetical protein